MERWRRFKIGDFVRLGNLGPGEVLEHREIDGKAFYLVKFVGSPPHLCGDRELTRVLSIKESTGESPSTPPRQ